MTWGFKRQLLYISVLAGFFLVFGFLLIYPQFNKPPTCVDGKMNGTETGIDCGGSCLNACLAEVEKIEMLWARAFQVVPGRYNALAYLANHNKGAVARQVNYRFQFFDESNIYIGERRGSTFIPPSGNFAIFESGVNLGEAAPVYTNFEILGEPNWIQAPLEKINQTKISLSNIEFANPATAPRLSATIKNTSLFTIPEISVIAILYDSMGNAVSASGTYLDKLSAQESRQIVFTWPEPFTVPIIQKELIPLYDISKVEWR